jgi:hypothetical protein
MILEMALLEANHTARTATKSCSKYLHQKPVLMPEPNPT